MFIVDVLRYSCYELLLWSIVYRFLFIHPSIYLK